MGSRSPALLWSIVALSTWAHAASSEASTTNALGRINQMESALRRSLMLVGPTDPGSSEAASRPKTPPPDLDSSAGSDPSSAVLQPQTSRLTETIDLTSANRLILNQLQLWEIPRTTHVSCTPGLQGLRDLEALPLCPNFQPCGERDHQEPQSGVVAACSAGFADPPAYSFPEEPSNCRAWREMDTQTNRRLMQPLLHANMSEAKAKNVLLLKSPELGCGQRRDFVPHAPVGYSVHRLKNVYVDSEATVFNRTTVFLRLGCRDGVHYSLPPEFTAGAWEVQKVGGVVNWAYRQGHNFYHSLVESFPLFLSLGPLMNKHRDLPFLGLKWQFDMYGSLLEPLVGVPLSKLRRYEMRQTDLYHAETVFQPVYQYCGRLSRSLWSELRRRHLLHPQGIPLFGPDWSMRPTTPLSDRELALLPDDWVVVLGQRPGMERSIEQAEELLGALQGLFPPERLVVFKGDLSIVEARDLFRRARLFVAGHGAALANMIFMPSESSLLELRPRGYENNCFHSLAEACSLSYNLLMGEGTKFTNLSVNVTEVVTLIRNISQNW